MAPGRLDCLRNLRDWGLADLGEREKSRTEIQRAGKIKEEFEGFVNTGGVSRAVIAVLVVFTRSDKNILRPSWLESLDGPSIC